MPEAVFAVAICLSFCLSVIAIVNVASIDRKRKQSLDGIESRINSVVDVAIQCAMSDHRCDHLSPHIRPHMAEVAADGRYAYRLHHHCIEFDNVEYGIEEAVRALYDRLNLKPTRSPAKTVALAPEETHVP